LLDQIDERLGRWARSVLAEATVSFAPPRAMEPPGGAGAAAAGGASGGPSDGVVVGLYLMELSHRPAARSNRRPPLSITLRYLITAWADDPAAAHRAIGALVFEAMKTADLEVEPDPLPLAAWAAFGVPPRPSFLVRVAVQQPWDERLAPPVREVQTEVLPLRPAPPTPMGTPPETRRGRDGKPAAGAVARAAE
jgi:hypothetical protein